MATVSQYRSQEAQLALMRQPQGRLRTLPSSVASREVRSQSAMFRYVSLLESHMAAQLASRLERHAPPPRTSVLEDIYTSAEDQATASWPKMKEHYGKWLTIRMTDFPGWERIDSLIEARNAIAHGVGELTPRMARRDRTALTRAFASVRITLNGTALQVSPLAVGFGAHLSCDFIVWMDEELAGYDEAVASLLPRQGIASRP